MRVGIVGGLRRAERLYGRVASDGGHEALFHDGAMSAPGARALEHLIDRCDLVVVLTDVNSHGAVRFARQRMKQRGRSPLLLRRCSPARFEALLKTMRFEGTPAANDPAPAMAHASAR